MSHFRYPDASTDRPCRLCEHWGGPFNDGLHARCVRDEVQIVAQPERGCAFWLRCIGADDEEPKKDKR